MSLNVTVSIGCAVVISISRTNKPSRPTGGGGGADST